MDVGKDRFCKMYKNNDEGLAEYIQSAADAINNGEMTFAGKYDEPDYELLVGDDCDLAI